MHIVLFFLLSWLLAATRNQPVVVAESVKGYSFFLRQRERLFRGGVSHQALSHRRADFVRAAQRTRRARVDRVVDARESVRLRRGQRCRLCSPFLVVSPPDGTHCSAEPKANGSHVTQRPKQCGALTQKQQLDAPSFGRSFTCTAIVFLVLGVEEDVPAWCKITKICFKLHFLPK